MSSHFHLKYDTCPKRKPRYHFHLLIRLKIPISLFSYFFCCVFYHCPDLTLKKRKQGHLDQTTHPLNILDVCLKYLSYIYNGVTGNFFSSRIKYQSIFVSYWTTQMNYIFFTYLKRYSIINEKVLQHNFIFSNSLFENTRKVS